MHYYCVCKCWKEFNNTTSAQYLEVLKQIKCLRMLHYALELSAVISFNPNQNLFGPWHDIVSFIVQRWGYLPFPFPSWFGHMSMSTLYIPDPLKFKNKNVFGLQICNEMIKKKTIKEFDWWILNILKIYMADMDNEQIVGVNCCCRRIK